MSPGAQALRLDVAYTLTFTALEQFLGANGLSFEERIQIVGDDPGEATDVIRLTFPIHTIQAPAASITRTHSVEVSRSSLDEDSDWQKVLASGWNGSQFYTRYLPDADELFARVEVGYVGFGPTTARADSAVSTLAASWS